MEDQRSKVLVVDDDDWILDGLCEVLTPAGYEVQTASDGLNAVRRMEETRFEVVLSDFCMPGMNGLALPAVICKRWPDTRVVMLSSIPSGETSQFALQQGAYAWLSKPYKPAHLLKTLEAAVHRPVAVESVKKRVRPVAMEDTVLTGGPSSHVT